MTEAGGSTDTIAVIVRRVKRDRWLLTRRQKLQSASGVVLNARENLQFVMNIISNETEFDPAQQIVDADGRLFWQQRFGKVRRASAPRVAAGTHSIATLAATRPARAPHTGHQCQV